MQKRGSLFLVTIVALAAFAPASARAGSRTSRNDIIITRSGEFDRAHGVRSGKGTAKSPYVISGWDVHTLTISDTSKAVRILDNTIHNLTLNWIGKDVVVRSNNIGDMRVNENIPRFGAPTAGSIDHNTFDVVGQLRHFDGAFMWNTVGTPEQDSPGNMFSRQAVNFDGFNGARFSYNTIYGFVDARLHGHHHSSSYAAGSHMHSGPEHEMTNHADRWHQVFIEGNKIFTSNSYGLEYVDTNHADNDRTAASETNPELNAPHIHHTRVFMRNNQVTGGGILVNVFNATDEIHKPGSYGSMVIQGNRVTLRHGTFYPFELRNGIEVLQAQGLALQIIGNTVTAPAPEDLEKTTPWIEQTTAGISIHELDRATVSILKNTVSNAYYGVSAQQMTKSVTWTVTGLVTRGVTQDVTYDDSVANKPRRK